MMINLESFQMSEISSPKDYLSISLEAENIDIKKLVHLEKWLPVVK